MAGRALGPEDLAAPHRLAARALDHRVVLDEIAERLQAHQGVVAEIAGQLVHDNAPG